MRQIARHAYTCSLAFASFSQKHPAFLYGLFIYLGALFAITWQIEIAIPLVLILILSHVSASDLMKRRLSLVVACAVATFCYVSQFVSLPPKHYSELPGQAHLEITDIGSDCRYGRTFYSMKAQIKLLQPDCGGFLVANVPCRLVWNEKNYRPVGGVLYSVRGILKQETEGYSFKPELHSVWEQKAQLFSLAEQRYYLKNNLRCFLAKYISPGSVRSFLEGVLLGQFNDMHLKSSLKRFGVQHIVVVSGFHFALLIAICMTCFRCFFSFKLSCFFGLICAALFFLFIGATPSVLRAFIATCALLLAGLFEKSSSGVNALGLALIGVVFLDPVSCIQPGFTLSFLATWAILLFLPLFQSAIISFFCPPSTLSIAQGNLFEKLVYVLSTFILTSWSLVFAVTVCMLPVMLYAFHSFPLMGLIYNSFFPFGIALALFFVVLGSLFFWVPPICATFLSIGALICEYMLVLVEYAPAWVDLTIYCNTIALWLVVSYLCVLSLVAITYTFPGAMVEAVRVRSNAPSFKEEILL